LGTQREFRRKVRTLTGNYQLLQLAPWLLRKDNPLRFEFISHKLIRLVVPFALLITIAAAAFLSAPFYPAAFWMQVGFYGLSLVGWTKWNLGAVSRLGDAAFTFVALNAAAVVAFANFVTGRKTWIRPIVQREIKA
jgi:hypothetical protein